MIRSRSRVHRAFTLVELLAVIAIIGVLAAIVIASVGSVRESARSSRCGSNIRQIQSLALLWAKDNRDWVPQGLWFQADIQKSRAGATNLRNVGYTDELGKCDGTDELAPNYGINSNLVQGGPAGQWGNNYTQYYEHGRYKYSQIQTSSTIVFAETAKVSGWSFGGASSYMALNVGGTNTLGPRHSGKAWVAYADGHVQLKAPADIATDPIWTKGITN